MVQVLDSRNFLRSFRRLKVIAHGKIRTVCDTEKTVTHVRGLAVVLSPTSSCRAPRRYLRDVARRRMNDQHEEIGPGIESLLLLDEIAVSIIDLAQAVLHMRDAKQRCLRS
jgi:hypothetical protein